MRVLRILCISLAALLAGCVVVPQNRRGRLADRIMQLEDDALETYRKQKLYSTREAAAGGDGAAAGGGCGCQ
jgi:starvation-inducible outer membrane lipoprotein